MVSPRVAMWAACDSCDREAAISNPPMFLCGHLIHARRLQPARKTASRALVRASRKWKERLEGALSPEPPATLT